MASNRMTPMIMQRQFAVWLGAIVLVAFVIWLLSGILLPFVAGLAIAYFLDPFADRLEAHGLSRLMATTVISVFFTLIAIAIALLILPILYQQTLAFIDIVPSLVKSARQFLMEASDGRLSAFFGRQSEVQKAVNEVTTGGLSWLLSLLPSIGSQGLALVGLVSLLVVTPVVAFYMLLDWDRMIARIDELLPRQHADTIRSLATEINEVLSGFVRGQGTVCLVLGIFYGIGLSLAGLKFGLVIGIMTGILTFIPYLGSITGFIVSTSLACFQFWPNYGHIGVIVGIFAVGQFVEGNFLAPKLVGEKVRLHPVWVMFALFAFSALFGFAGALLAVPVAAALGVLARFAVGQYEHSRAYLGEKAEVDPSAETGD